MSEIKYITFTRIYDDHLENDGTYWKRYLFTKLSLFLESFKHFSWREVFIEIRANLLSTWDRKACNFYLKRPLFWNNLNINWSVSFNGIKTS